jgi:hypothetical protein
LELQSSLDQYADTLTAKTFAKSKGFAQTAKKTLAASCTQQPQEQQRKWDLLKFKPTF